MRRSPHAERARQSAGTKKADGRLAELLGTGPVEVLDGGPTVTVSVTIPGHLAPAVRAAILAAAPDATVTSPHRSNERMLTITTPQAPQDKQA